MEKFLAGIFIVHLCSLGAFHHSCTDRKAKTLWISFLMNEEACEQTSNLVKWIAYIEVILCGIIFGIGKVFEE